MTALVASVSTTTGTVSASINTTGADIIAIAVSDFSGGVTPTDNKGNTYTQAVSVTTTRQTPKWFTCHNPVVGAGHTFNTTGSNGFIAALAFSGTASGTVVDQTHGGISGALGSTTVSTGSVTPTQDGEIILAMMSIDDPSITTAPTVDSGLSGVTFDDNVPGSVFGLATAWKVQSAAAAINVTFTRSVAGTNSAGQDGALILTIKTATKPPVAPLQKPILFKLFGLKPRLNFIQPQVLTAPSTATASLTGAGITASAGSFADTGAQGIAGTGVTAAAGTLADAVTEFLAGAGTIASGGNFADAVLQALSGAGATASGGNFVDVATKALLGAGVTVAAGTIGDAVTELLTGAGVTASAGNLADAGAQGIIGAGVTAAAGTISTSTGNSQNITLTGAGITASAGNLADAVTQGIAGAGTAANAGTIAPGRVAALSGAGVASVAGMLGDSALITLPGAGVIAGAGTFGAVTGLAGAAAAASAGVFLDAFAVPLSGTGAVSAAGNFAPKIFSFMGAALTANAASFQFSIIGGLPPPAQRTIFTLPELRVAFAIAEMRVVFTVPELRVASVGSG